MGRHQVITIDGPAGAGKSTVGRLLAQSLGFSYVDSGAFYRAVAWQVLSLKLNLDDLSGLQGLLGQFCLQVQADSVSFRLFLNGRELSRELRTPEVSQAASRVAANPQVRQWVQEQLHRLAAEGSIVAEGRDLGSAVFPTASVKFYLDADLAARAARRQQEWQQQATELDMEATMAELARRDQQDKNRAASPLHIPPGAVCLDTTRLTPTEVVGRCLEVIRQGSSSQ